MTTPRALPENQERDDRTTIAVFATVMATTIAALYYLGRWGFDNPVCPVLTTLGLSFFITVAPLVVWRLVTQSHYAEPEPWWRTQPALTLAALGLTALAGMLVPATGWNAMVVLGVAGFASALVAVVIWMRHGGKGTNLLFLMGAIVFATWACGVAWSTRYKTPVFWETLEYQANVHHDPLYNVSMANTMRTYGMPSTGLDGFPYTPYHYGAAWLNSQWAYLANTDVLEFYSLGPPVIVIPLFFSAILMLAVEVRKAWRSSVADVERPLRSDYAAWIFLIAATVGVIPTSGLDAMGIWNQHALISESYVIGIPVFLLVMATTIGFWRRKVSSPRPDDVVFLLVFAPAMLVALAFLKISLMVLFLCAGFALLLLGRLYRDRWLAASAAICVAVSVVAYKLVSVAAQNQGLAPFAYIRFSGVNTEWWPYFILIHLFWSWLYIYLRLREEKLNDVGAIRQAVLEGRLTDVVVMATVAVAGFLPGELVDIHGGSAIYFSDVQRWLAIALLMASAPRWLAQVRANREAASGERRSLGSIRLSHLWIAALILPISITLILNVIRAPMTALRANVALRQAFYAQAGIAGSVGIRSLADSRLLAIGLHRSPAYKLIAALRDLDRMPPAIKRRTLLFIPQSYGAFWRIWKGERGRCSYTPMIAPATSGLALLDGMPPVDCDVTDQYGMLRYHRRTVPQTPADAAPAALCAKARAKGFPRVVVLNGSPSGEVSVKTVDCGVQASSPASESSDRISRFPTHRETAGLSHRR
ncbi:MAG TPA: hypothetical protein VES88_05370 [Gemmatimonadaceae bacterium]|nr:hypothetical protein [Gemmatimonadaceae bacterium]